MFHKHLFLASFLLSVGGGLTGCAVDTGDPESGDTEQSATDSMAISGDTEQSVTDSIAISGDSGASSDTGDQGSDEKIATESARGCTSAEINIAEQHADDHHTQAIPTSSNTLDPHVTSCHVSNGYIVYTYAY